MIEMRNLPILLGPDQGRTYALGPMRAVFKADEAETDAAYSISDGGWSPIRPAPGRIAMRPTTTFSTSWKARPASCWARNGSTRRRAPSCARPPA